MLFDNIQIVNFLEKTLKFEINKLYYQNLNSLGSVIFQCLGYNQMLEESNLDQQFFEKLKQYVLVNSEVPAIRWYEYFLDIQFNENIQYHSKSLPQIYIKHHKFFKAVRRIQFEGSFTYLDSQAIKHVQMDEILSIDSDEFKKQILINQTQIFNINLWLIVFNLKAAGLGFIPKPYFSFSQGVSLFVDYQDIKIQVLIKKNGFFSGCLSLFNKDVKALETEEKIHSLPFIIEKNIKHGVLTINEKRKNEDKSESSDDYEFLHFQGNHIIIRIETNKRYILKQYNFDVADKTKLINKNSKDILQYESSDNKINQNQSQFQQIQQTQKTGQSLLNNNITLTNNTIGNQNKTMNNVNNFMKSPLSDSIPMLNVNSNQLISMENQQEKRRGIKFPSFQHKSNNKAIQSEIQNTSQSQTDMSNNAISSKIDLQIPLNQKGFGNNSRFYNKGELVNEDDIQISMKKPQNSINFSINEESSDNENYNNNINKNNLRNNTDSDNNCYSKGNSNKNNYIQTINSSNFKYLNQNRDDCKNDLFDIECNSNSFKKEYSFSEQKKKNQNNSYNNNSNQKNNLEELGQNLKVNFPVFKKNSSMEQIQYQNEGIQPVLRNNYKFKVDNENQEEEYKQKDKKQY
ncbi:hypothetical protein PPERSA_02442 [Pseudocohnilembus persalinus]|uniref:Uncharacterized protein n=1 Tax=Pseudocohnilembus persalinus TaxID=266149 RepID=A0A0V0QAW2_PSEPJ|nr:hypothetical protein PPERSA_02442 [Pseudocohnilembus persalinus]|eukprot:KRW99330.1 hypothetical protein PPERSA_02442 [Pseudocohnilembus persalinus]